MGIKLDELVVFIHYVNVGVASPSKVAKILGQYQNSLVKVDQDLSGSEFTIKHYVLGVRNQQPTEIKCIYPLPMEDDYLEQKTLDMLNKLEKELSTQ